MDAIYLLLRLVGRRLIRVRRVFHAHGGGVSCEDGPLELTFEPESTVVLNVGADGEDLSIREDPWLDPFEEPLSADNQAWVAEHGRWSAFDESERAEYNGLIGSQLRSVRPLLVGEAKVCGARLTFEARTIDFVGSADEALVFLDEQNDLRLAAMRVYVGEQVTRGSDSLGRDLDAG